jgi:mono/diheme cytochrome c family protein
MRAASAAGTLAIMVRWIVRIALVGAGAFVLIQLIPYGRNHTNPPVQAEPAWNTPRTRQLAQAACFDCHSNLTKWRWYSNVAPVSWLVYRDVHDGRSALNFSEWNKPQDGAGDAVEAVGSGSMPPWFYVIMHPNAHLSSIEKGDLMRGLAATLRSSPPIGGG